MAGKGKDVDPILRGGPGSWHGIQPGTEEEHPFDPSALPQQAGRLVVQPKRKEVLTTPVQPLDPADGSTDAALASFSAKKTGVQTSKAPGKKDFKGITGGTAPSEAPGK